MGSGAQVGLQAEAGPPMQSENSEVELSNLVQCSSLSRSQDSLKSSSSVGSVRGDEGGLYADFYGDYCPLFDNRQESATFRGKAMTCVLYLRPLNRHVFILTLRGTDVWNRYQKLGRLFFHS